jgi:uncharacterized protein (DUF1697 family)
MYQKQQPPNGTITIMTKYIALLRGIAPMNPNMRNEKLRDLFEGLGFKNVRTIISSGNVVFESPQTDIPALEAKLEAAFPEKLGFTSTTIIRSQQQIQDLVDRRPFGDREHSKKTSLNVTFLKNEPKDLPKTPFTPEGRDYLFVDMSDRAICSVVDTTLNKTPDLMMWLEKRFGREITTRTWKTVERILNTF